MSIKFQRYNSISADAKLIWKVIQVGGYEEWTYIEYSGGSSSDILVPAGDIVQWWGQDYYDHYFGNYVANFEDFDFTNGWSDTGRYEYGSWSKQIYKTYQVALRKMN